METKEDRPSILIADDEAGVRRVLCGLARRVLCAETIEGHDGKGALDLFVQRRPDVVVTDIRMPGLDGVTLLKRVKSVDPIVPVILVTGYPSLDVAIQGMKEGASDFLTKPFQLEHVKVVLEKALRERRFLQENQTLKEEIQRKRAIERLNEELHRRVQELSALSSLGETIASFPLNQEAILRSLIDVAEQVTHCRRISVLVPLDGGSSLRTMVQNSNGSERSSEAVIALKPGELLEQAVQLKMPFIRPSTGRPGDPSMDRASRQKGGNSQIAVPLLNKGQLFGVLHASGKVEGTDFDAQDLKFLSELAKHASLGLENRILYDSIFEVLMSTLRSLVSTIEAKDPYTKEHSQRVTDLSLLLAGELGCSPEQIDTVRLAGYLHDLGKLGVKDSILLKPGRLTPEEYEQIKAHPVIGESILAPIGFLPEERAVIRHHHERWDGRGYPDGLSGEKIPFLARILAVGDAFDAMTSDRPYRPRMSFPEGHQEILDCKGTQFDPQVVEAFQAVFPHWMERARAKRGENVQDPTDVVERRRGEIDGIVGGETGVL